MSRSEKKLTKEQVVARVNDLLSAVGSSYAKYMRNYGLYNQTPVTDLRSKNPLSVGYQDDLWSEDSTVPKINVIKSVVDSVVSMLTTAKVRPFVNTVKGSFKTIQIAKQLQIFYDYFFDEQNVQAKVGEALRDACVFDTGYLYLDEVTGDVVRVQPWNVYTRPSEQTGYKSVYIEFPNMSLDSMKDEDYDLLTANEKNLISIQTLGYFYDSRTRTKATLINRQIRDIIQVESDVVPLVAIHYTPPVIGNTNLSIADMLKGIQVEIDQLMQRIADASVLNPALTFFLDNATNIKVGQLNNRVGSVVQYNSAQGSNPVEVATQNFIADQYITMLDNLMEKAYNLAGISSLNAMGKKPTGVDSGVAMATLDDLTSDRFQQLLDAYIRSFNDLAKIMAKMFSANKNIVKPSRYSLSLTWGDVSEEYDKMRIQFSAADSLSKDPSEKLKQLQALAQAGIIPATQIASLLELPDINRGYNVANNAYNACMTLIDQCIYEDKFEVPDYVPFQMLKEQILNMQLSLRAAMSEENNNDKDIEKLKKYYEVVEDREEELTAIQQEEMAGEQAMAMQDPSLNNMYSPQNNENLTGGTESSMNMEDENVAGGYDTSAANGGELGGNLAS